MMQIPENLSADVGEACAWLTQMLAQLLDGAAPELDFGPDPMATIRAIDGLRGPLHTAGLYVPPLRDADLDPVGNMIDWRDFLATIRTVH